MSPETRYKRSRDNWRQKATSRAEKNRTQAKDLARVKAERNKFKEELKEARARVRQMESQSRVVVLQSKVDLVFLALQLFTVARIGFRAVSRVLGTVMGALGIKKNVPCPQTIINWVTRLSLVRTRSTPMLQAPSMANTPLCNGLIYMIDMSIGLGTGKILSVLALNAHHHQLSPSAPGLHDVHCMAVSVADSWTGESIAAFLERLIASAGRPAAYLKDGGADLQKAIRLLDEQGLASPCIDDISHVIANLLKWWYQDQPLFETFLSACGRVSGKLKQTVFACLAPPKVLTKARFMNVHRLIQWADRLLALSPAGGARKGSLLSKLRACMDRLPSCRAFIKRFRDDAVPLLECQRILKARGLSHATIAQCEPFIQAIGSDPIRRKFTLYLQAQLQTAFRLGLDHIGLPVTSDQIESLFGLGKLHGTGEVKDANRIALRQPALCGIPTREEAEQVVKITVAEERQITGCFTSLVKQRREVLPHPDRLESLVTEQGGKHLELIAGVKNREKSEETLNLSASYEIDHGPRPQCQAGNP